MEDPPITSDGVQPEVPPPTCTLPRVFDLTKNGEECLLKTNPIEALHTVQLPGWYLSSGTTNGMVLPENQLDPLLQPIEQIQPDNALSNTTVTLSYMTRSHVFDGNASPLQHPQIYTVPLSKAFSLHPTVYDDAQLVGSSPGPSLCVDMGQPCLQPVSMPIDLATCANPFDLVPPAQVVENVASLCYLQQAHGMGGLRNMESLALEALRSLQQEDPAECKIPVNLGDIQNGLWTAGSFDGSFPALPEDKNINPELVFLISRTGESTGLVVPLNQELINALNHSRLPSVSLVNGSKDHQAGPPSADDSLVEDIDNTTLDDSSNGDLNLLTNANKITDVSNASNASNEQNGNSSPEKLAQTEHKMASDKGTQSPLVSLGRRELPPRSTRGMRLEAIVQNMYPTRFKSGHTSCSKKSRTNQTANRGATQDVLLASDKHSAPKEECGENAVNKDDKATQLQEKEEDMDKAESSQISTSSSESSPKHSLPRTSPGTLHKPVTCAKKSKRMSGTASPLSKRSPESTSHKHTPTVSAHGGGSLVKKENKAKIVSPPKSKKKKKHMARTLSVFPPQEPEINLRYLMCKHGRKEKRDETFMPFIHLDRCAGSTCTVINYPEESTKLSRGKQHQAPQGKIPSVSFVQYGRVSSDGACPVPLVCCLCGGAANAMDLGDLHGPYYSEGLWPKDGPLSIVQGSREDDSSDSDSLDTAGPSALARTRKPRPRSQTAPPGIFQRLSCNPELSSSPAAKRARMDGVVDWYTPPVVPVHNSEFWLHEDCGVWSAGVFLVKGKLYGLENAVKVANQTVCSCCHKPGASLGCFFKNCPNKYHYLCAVQSGCVLNADNFSMKCRKHKNKSIKAVSPHKPRDR